MAKYHVAIIRPEGYLHSEGFREVAEGLHTTLLALGHTVVTAENSIDALATNIVLGAHLLTEEEVAQLLPGSIVYNLEQLGGASLPRWYMQMASRLQIWDYSRINLEHWRAVPYVAPPKLVEIGFVPELERIEPAPVEDIDVLFYGSVNERRLVVLQALESSGLRVQAVFGVYGQERDALIRRAKVVLNLHAYQTEIFEVVRVSYLLTNVKAVVAEDSPDIGELADAVLVGGYEELAALCVHLVADDPARRALAQRGAAIFRSRPQIEILRAVLFEEPQGFLAREGGEHARLASTSPSAAPAFPRKLNLGSGKDWREDCLNIDINDYWMPDAVLDLAQPQAKTIELTTERFGSITLEQGCFDEILANDVLEHIPHLTSAMGSALRLLAPGGLFRIQVPYDLSWGGWQDPTHVRAFNERSWLYYTDWFWYLGWTEARFAVDALEFVLSPIGERLKDTCTGEDLIRTPRAVDSMRVTLKKVPLTEQEKHFVANYLKRPERQPASQQEALAVALV